MFLATIKENTSKTKRPYIRGKRERVCPICKISFLVNDYQIRKGWGLFCSTVCHWEGQKGQKLSEEHRKKLSQAKQRNPVRYWLGKKRPDIARSARERLLGIKPSAKAFQLLAKARAEGRCHNPPLFFGEKHWNWKGGITSENARIRASDEYKEWRQKVFERDKYMCAMCLSIGGKLHAHHIKYFSQYPELRVVISNGRTLCNSCHYAEHKDPGAYINFSI